MSSRLSHRNPFAINYLKYKDHGITASGFDRNKKESEKVQLEAFNLILRSSKSFSIII